MEDNKLEEGILAEIRKYPETAYRYIIPKTKEEFEKLFNDFYEYIKEETNKPLHKFQVPGILAVGKYENGQYLWSDKYFKWFFSEDNIETDFFPMGSELYKEILERAKSLGIEL